MYLKLSKNNIIRKFLYGSLNNKYIACLDINEAKHIINEYDGKCFAFLNTEFNNIFIVPDKDTEFLGLYSGECTEFFSECELKETDRGLFVRFL